MKKQFLYILSEYLSDNAALDDMWSRAWPVCIYRALLVSNLKEKKSLVWTKYNEWDIEHKFRALRAKERTKKTTLTSVEIRQRNNDTVNINCTLQIDEEERDLEFIYERDAFLKDLWERKSPRNTTLLLGEYERDRLFDSSVSIKNNEVFIAEPQLRQTNVQPKRGSAIKKQKKPKRYEPVRAIEKDNLYRQKFEVFHAILQQLRSLYHNSQDQQKAFIETVLGAGLFYLPSGVRHFAGFISHAALITHVEGGRKVKDHIFPRKMAARELLKSELSFADFVHLYDSKLARFMYVTPSENSLLVNYFEKHDSHDSALKALDIKKFPNTAKDKFENHSELIGFLNYLIQGKRTSIGLDDATELLLEFRSGRKN